MKWLLLRYGPMLPTFLRSIPISLAYTLARRLNPILVILFAVVIISYQMFSQPLSTPVADAVGYLNVAFNLDVYGVYSSTYTQLSADPLSHNIFFTPLYPAFLTLAAKLSPAFSDYACCIVSARGQPLSEVSLLCPHRVNLALIFQLVLAVLSGVLAYIAAHLISHRRSCAWLAMILVLATGEYAYYATLYLTEILVFPLFTVLTIFLVCAWRKPSLWAWAAVGVTLALLTLLRPSFVYLAYFVLLCHVVYFILPNWRRPAIGISQTAAGVAAFALFAGPWVIINWLILGTPAISDGYASFIFVQRIAYNAMTLGEWLVSWVYWLPDFGDSWASRFFSPDLYNRLTFAHPDSFYTVGNTVLRAETLEAAGGPSNHLDYLLSEYLFADFWKHVLVTFALAWRGIWISKYPGAIMLLLFVPVLVMLIRRRRYELMVFFLPSLFMLGFHAFVSVSISRYNLVMLPALAIGSSVPLAWLARRLGCTVARLMGMHREEGNRAGD